MKKTISTLILLCVISIGFAQSKKDKALTLVTEDVCKCINEQDTSKMSRNQLEIQLGVCIAKAYAKHQEILKDTYNISFSDEKAMEAFGEEIGMKMLEVCPETLMLIAQEYIGDDMEETLSTESENVTVVSGYITDIQAELFNVVTFKDENKRSYKLLWLEYFQGQELLSDIKSLKKKQVKLSYANREMYDPQLKDYRTYRVLQKIEVEN